MRRGLGGLPIVLGTLWVATSAGASTLLYASLWDGGAAPFEPRSFLVDELSEDYAGSSNGSPEAATLSYERRGSPYTIPGYAPSTRQVGPVPDSYARRGAPSGVLAGGAPRFGRRDFVWYPSPVVVPSPPLPTLPGERVLYDPLGRFPGLDGQDPSDASPWLFAGPSPDLLRRQDIVEQSWRILRDLVVALPDPDSPHFPLHLDSLDDWDSTLIAVHGPGWGPDDVAGPAPSAFEGTSAVGDPSGSSGVATAIPEPTTGALLLAGLCALAARRRRC